jgi:hypothetical protein
MHTMFLAAFSSASPIFLLLCLSFHLAQYPVLAIGAKQSATCFFHRSLQYKKLDEPSADNECLYIWAA